MSVIVFALSLVIYPIMLKVTKSSASTLYISIIYFIFVLKNIISYLYAHKWSLINADQKGYVLVKYNILFNIVTLLARIAILSVTNNYILYLLIEILILVFQNIFNGKIVDKRYPYVKTKEIIPVEKETKNNIIKNVRALFLHNIGSYCVNGTDNILISAFVNLKTVGLYSNYTMIIGQLSSLVSPILGGLNASIGNLIATENEDKSYQIFKVTYMVNFWIYSVCVIFLYNLLEPFLNWWIGEGYLLDRFTFIIVLLNFYLTGMRISISTFKNKAGIFVQDKYVPLIESVINLGASIILVKYFGLVGIFLGTTISTISIVFWNVPRLVYKYVFKSSLLEYFIKYFAYVVITLLVGLLTTGICNYFIDDNSFISLVYRGIICIIVPNIIYLGIFFKTSEFKYLLNTLKNMLPQFIKKRIAV